MNCTANWINFFYAQICYEVEDTVKQILADD